MLMMFPFVVAAAALLTLFVVAVAPADVLTPGTVNPFAPAGPAARPGEDTIAPGEAMVRTVLAPAHPGWHAVTLDNLTEVESLLDCLEAQGFEDREVDVLGADRFAVRWK